MNIALSTADSLKLLNSINYVDSSLFGLSVDPFKIRLFCTFRQSVGLLELGFEEGGAHLCLEFRLTENLKIDLNKSNFTPPYLEDGDLAAVDLLDFDSTGLDLKKIGFASHTDRLGGYQERREHYEVRFTFVNATLQFLFVDLEISVFEPSDLDNKYALSSAPA